MTANNLPSWLAWQEYLEKRRAGKVSKEDKFMVLCTQPRPVVLVGTTFRSNCVLNRKCG